MSEIRNLTRNGETFYPLTTSSAVINEATGEGLVIDDEPTAGSENLVKSGGVWDIYQGQLFFLEGYWDGAVFIGSTSYRATNFIPIINITEISVVKLHLYTTQNVIQFFNANFEFISGVAGLGPGDATPVTGTIQIPSNAKYVTFATMTQKLANAKISGFESTLMYATRFKEVFDSLKSLSDAGDKKLYESGVLSKHGYINVLGSFEENENYRCSEYLPVNSGDTIKVEELFQYDAFDVISYYSNGLEYISGVKGLGASSSNPVTGSYTIPTNVAYVRFTTLSQHMSLANVFIGSSLNIASNLLGKIIGSEGSQGELVVKVSNSGDSHYLSVFEPTGDATKPYIGVLFRRLVNAEKNTDVWCTAKMGYYDAAFNEISGGNIVLDGEWDGVIMEADENGDPYPDFLGGYVHGNENMDSITIKVDGKDFSVSEDKIINADNVTLICHSYLNRYGEPSTNVIEKIKTIEVSHGKIKISNTFKALTAIRVYQFFPVMLPINREYSQYCVRKNRSEVFDDRTTSHPVVYSHFAQDTYLRQYNDSFIMETSIKASMRNDIDAADRQYDAEGVKFSYYVSASANPAYNKIYYLMASPNTLESGNIINCEATFKFRGK